MKWRQSVVYLAVLLLVGGYYAYFEVMKKAEKEEAEKAAKKVFQVQKDQIQAIWLTSRDKQVLRLKKDGQWVITDPIRTDADQNAVGDLLNALSGLDLEKRVISAPVDLKPFGLQEPALHVRFQTGEQWQELVIGDKTPVGDGHYAKTGAGNDVFTLTEASWSGLNKGSNDLRRRQLLTSKAQDVTALQIAWNDGTRIEVAKDPETGAWKAGKEPELKIKAGKVDSLLQQVLWLRAQEFLSDDPGNLASFGLTSPYVSIQLTLRDNRQVNLLMTDKSSQDKKATALSSELPAVVKVEGAVLGDLPRDVRALEDRSILNAGQDDVKAVKWRLGDTTAEVVRLEENKWGLKKDAVQEARPMESGWQVRSLLWDMKDSEYLARTDAPVPLPDQPYARVEILGDGNAFLGALTWNRPETGDTQPVTAWIQQGGETVSVQLKSETIGKITQDLERITTPQESR